MKKYVFVILFFLVSFQSFAKMFQVGEELEYEVSFLAVKLGTIKIVSLPDTIHQGEKVKHSQVFIQSNPGIPFYSLRAIFNSFMDMNLREGKYFEANMQENNDEWGFQRIAFRNNEQKNDSQKNYRIVRVEKWYNKEKINDTTIYSTERVIDGSTLFFLARQLVDRKLNVRMPTIMDLTVGDTKLFFTGKIDKKKIKAVNYPIKVYHFEGSADWVALYGLGGKFQGWFSCDDARVPIYATMRVYLGNVNIELKSWKRAGWTPPRF